MKFGTKFSNDEDYYKYFGILPIDKLAKRSLLLEKLSTMRGLERVSHSYSTRISLTEPAIAPRSKNRFGEKAYDYLMPRLWNELPLYVKESGSKNILKLN
jgi:hypothetical protein